MAETTYLRAIRLSNTAYRFLSWSGTAASAINI